MSAEVRCLTTAQMREIEATAIRSGAVSGLELMEVAARGVVDCVLRHWPGFQTAAHRALVLCGPGNNGGDGYGVARLLADRGWSVDVYAMGAPATPDAQAMAARGGAAQDLAELPGALDGYDLIVDALLGNGLSRPFERFGTQQLAVAQAQRGGVKLIAVDVPSGLCADSGRILGAASAPDDAIRADLTVTFETVFPGHLLGDGPEICGAVRVVPLGRAVASAARALEGGVALVRAPEPAALRKAQAAHKYMHGHVLVLSGGSGQTGAARLAARGALRTGAGAVSLAVPEAALAEVAAQVTAVMVRTVSDGGALDAVLQDARFNTLVLGPGLGTGRREADLLATALARGRGVVLDADALTLLARADPLRGGLHGACVLTPHDGEFARLCPDLAARLAEVPRDGPAFSRVDAARAAALRLGAVVVLKGPATVIAEPDGGVWIHGGERRRAPWLATAGSGDVLAGIIAGLMARGWSPAKAACAGVWLHAEAARGIGAGLIAEDLPEALPGVFKGLGV